MISFPALPLAGLGLALLILLAIIWALRRSRGRHLNMRELQTIFDYSQAGILLMRGGRRVYRCNKRLAEIFGYDSEAELEGKDARILHFSEAHYEEFGQKHYQRLASNERVVAEYRMRRKDGSGVWLLLTGKAVDGHTPADLSKGVIWMINDITERKEAQDLLSRSERNLRTIVHNAAEAIAIFRRGAVVFMNPSMEQLTGYSAAELKEMSFLECIHADDRDMVQERYARRLRSPDKVDRFDFRLRHKDGSMRWVMMTATAIDWEGRRAFLGLLSDITERVIANQELLEAERRYREIFENAPVAIFKASPEGRFITVNPEYARIMGFDSPEHMIGSITDIARQMYVDPAQRDTYRREINVQGHVHNYEVKLKKRTGEEFWAAMNSKEVYGPDGEVVSYDGFLTDVTAHKKMHDAMRLAQDLLERQVAERTRELREANEQLIELNLQKSTFLSSASHELRTPLTSVLGFAKISQRSFEKHFSPLATTPALENQARQISGNLGIILQEGERLTRLVNDLLDLNKIESGRMEWRDQDTPALDLIDTAVQLMESRFAELPDLDFRLELPETLPLLRVDRDRLTQVLTNLMDNAVKFTGKGAVTLNASAPLDAGGRRWVEFRIDDHGPGVPLEDREHIFEKYYQTHHAAAERDKPKGTGLGLAICKQIVDHYGGTIRVEDGADGMGAGFVVALPAAEERQTPAA